MGVITSDQKSFIGNSGNYFAGKVRNTDPLLNSIACLREFHNLQHKKKITKAMTLFVNFSHPITY